MPDEHGPGICAMCLKPADGEMLFLAAYAVQSAETPNRAVVYQGGPSVWLPDDAFEEDGSAWDAELGGTLLHWPVCASQWIKGEMLEQAITAR